MLGPGRGNGNDAPLLVSDESGAAFVALDINSPSMLSESDYKMPGNKTEQRHHTTR